MRPFISTKFFRIYFPTKPESFSVKINCFRKIWPRFFEADGKDRAIGLTSKQLIKKKSEKLLIINGTKAPIGF